MQKPNACCKGNVCIYIYSIHRLYSQVLDFRYFYFIYIYMYIYVDNSIRYIHVLAIRKKIYTRVPLCIVLLSKNLLFVFG